MPKAKGKISIIKIILTICVLWAGIKYYNAYQASQAINYDIIPKRDSKEISQEELMSFLPVWSDYMDRHISELGKRPVSLASGAPEDNLSNEAKEWLLRRLWYPNRFFYVEQRLRTILKTIEYQAQSENLIKELSRQYAALQAQQAQNSNPDSNLSSLMNSIENMIKEQKAKENVEKISPEEIKLVLPLRTVIKDALSKSQTTDMTGTK